MGRRWCMRYRKNIPQVRAHKSSKQSSHRRHIACDAMWEGRRRRRRRLKGTHISHPILWNFPPSITWTLEVCSQFFLAVSQMGHSINSRLPAAAAEISRNSPVMKSLWCIVQFVVEPLFCFNDLRRITNAFVFLYLPVIVHRNGIHTPSLHL